MNHEQDQQLFLDGLQPTDVPRITGNNQERTDRTKLEQFSEALGWLVTSYAIRHREMPKVVQVNGVDQQGLPITRFEIR